MDCLLLIGETTVCEESATNVRNINLSEVSSLCKAFLLFLKKKTVYLGCLCLD